MKKTILSAILLVVMLAASAFQAAAKPQEAAWKLLLAIPVGKGKIAYLSQPGFGRTQGPEAFTVAPDGTIYVLDSVNQRVYAARGQKNIRTIKLPGVFYPMDIISDNGNLTILDDTNRTMRYAKDGRLLNETNLPGGMKTEQVYRLAESNGKPMLWAQNSHEFNLEALPDAVNWAESENGKGLGPGIAAPDGTRWVAIGGGDWTQGVFMTPDGSQEITIEAYGLLGSARLVGFDQQSNLYILVEDLYDETPDKLGVELTIRKYAPDGKLLGVARFPQQSLVPSHRPVEVTSDGRVYAMIAGKQAVSIYAVTLGAGYTPKAWRAPLDQGDATNDSSPIQPKAFTSLSRSQVYNRARTMTLAAWTWYSSYDWTNAEFAGGQDRNRSALGPNTKPNQLIPLVDGKTVRGIPYYWGGYDSPWTKSDWAGVKWSNWNSALAYYRNQTPSKKGPLVGYVIANGGVYSGGAGIDCSGFVAAASGRTYVTKPGSQGLASQGSDWRGAPATNTVTVALRRLQPMNFLVTSNHILYYYRRSRDLSGIETLESTVAGSPQGAKSYKRIWSELQSYAYHRSWWYIAAGDSPEKAVTSQGARTTCYGAGQTIWYKFTVPAGARNVTLSDISAGDVDLYVYNELFKLQGSSKQIGTLDESVSISAAGTYYAMVHVLLGSGCITWSIAW
jgi:hypothetical protein